MKKKAFLAVAIVVLALVTSAFIANHSIYHSATHIVSPTDHAWKTYVDKKLGFSVAYPSDIAHPSLVEHPRSTDGIFQG